MTMETTMGTEGTGAVLRARRLSAAYDGKTVLHDVSLEVTRGGITAIVGPSGCGKSTLLHCLNGMLRGEPGATTGGEVVLVEADGTELDTATLPPEEVCRRVGLVFQTPSPFPFSVYKNITYVLRYYGFIPGGLGSKAKAQADEAVRACLDRVGLLDEVGDDLRRNALKLSGGQQQRLCIARALAARPEVLLLDESCSALDVKSTAVIESLLKGLADEVPVVIVTHNIAQARRIADDLVVMRDGEIVESGRASEVFERPASEFAREFLSGTFG